MPRPEAVLWLHDQDVCNYVLHVYMHTHMQAHIGCPVAPCMPCKAPSRRSATAHGLSAVTHRGLLCDEKRPDEALIQSGSHSIDQLLTVTDIACHVSASLRDFQCMYHQLVQATSLS